MKNIRNTIISLFLLTTCINGQMRIGIDTVIVNQNGLKYLLIEKVSVPSDIANDAIAYRLFVELEDDYRFLAAGAYMATDFPLYIETNTSFLNETTFGTMMGTSVNSLLFGIAPSLEYDSYAADGRMGNLVYTLNGLVPVDAGSTPVGPLSVPDNIEIFLDNTTKLEDSYDGWIVNGGVGGPASAPNQIFISQLTVVEGGTLTINFGLIALLNPSIKRKDIYNVKYPDSTPPEIEITSPVNGGTYNAGNMISIQATASDVDGSIDSVVFYINGNRFHTDVTEPYKTDWLAQPGTISITAKAFDNDGKSSVSEEVVIEVSNEFPIVNITSPVSGSVFYAGDLITLEATATDNDGEVTLVSFYVNNVLVGSDNTLPYSIDWTAKYGETKIFAEAIDNYGYESRSDTIIIQVEGDNSPPLVYFNSIEEGDTIKAGIAIDIYAIAIDDDKIERLEFYSDELLIGTDNNSESDSIFSIAWTPGIPGIYNLRAIAYDSDGAFSDSSLSIIVINNQKPFTQIISPQEGQRFDEGLDIAIQVEAMDSDGSVDTIEVFINDAIEHIFTNTSPWYFAWESRSGTATIYSVATDNNGAKDTSEVVTIFIGPENDIPLVSISSPIQGSVFTTGEEVVMQASVIDTSGVIDSVEFFVNDIKIGASIDEPYSIKWIAVGETAQLKAKAIDSYGAIGHSEKVTITILENEAPEVSIVSPQEGQIFGLNAIVSILAEASDSDGSINSVTFFANGSYLNKDTLPPYEAEWITNTPGESISVIASAKDNKGKQKNAVIHIIVTEDGPVKIPLVLNNEVYVYPNPVRDLCFLNIGIADYKNGVFKLYNASGSLLIYSKIGSSPDGTVEIDLSPYSTGIYFAVIAIDDHLFTAKLVKQ